MVIVGYRQCHIVYPPRVVIIGISNGFPIVHIEVGIVVREPLHFGAVGGRVAITLVGRTRVGQYVSELALGVAISVIVTCVGACIRCSPIMVASLQE